MHSALVTLSKSLIVPSLPFDKFLRHLFCEKVAANAINELPSLVEAMLHEANYTEIMAHFNQFRFIAAKPR